MGIGLSSSSSDDGGDGGAEAGGEVDGGRDGPLRQLPAAELEQRLLRPRLFSAVDAIVLIDVVVKNVMDVDIFCHRESDLCAVYLACTDHGEFSNVVDPFFDDYPLWILQKVP